MGIGPQPSRKQIHLALTYARRRFAIGCRSKIETATKCAEYLKIDPPTNKKQANVILVRFYADVKCLTPEEKRAVFPLWPSKKRKQQPDLPHEATDAFLEGYEWRRLRMEVLKEQGARCQCCGATPKDGVRMHVDHIKPRRKFPELALEKSNLQVLCEVCNHGKGNWDQTDWRKEEARLPNEAYAPMWSKRVN